MDLRLTPDQTALLTAISGLAAPFQEKPIDFHGFALVSSELEQTSGNVAEAARRAGVDRVTLFRTIRRYGLRGHEGEP